MAQKATIFKAELQVSDLDRNRYGTWSLTLARHPSETDERMMVRVLAFALHADDRLEFGRGLAADDEPDLWLRDRSGAIQAWIDVGLPDERLVRRACGRAVEVFVYGYGGRAVSRWWTKHAATLARSTNLTVLNVAAESSRALAALALRSMQLQCTVQDGHIWFSDATRTVAVETSTLRGPALL